MSKKKNRVCPVGGQALIEGIMMRSKSAMVMCVRDPEGEIRTKSKRLSGGGFWGRMPVIRGIIKFVESLVSGTKSLNDSAKVSLPEDNAGIDDAPKKSSKGAAFLTILAMVAGFALAIGLFFLLPGFLAGLIQGWIGFENHLIYSLIEGGIRLTLFVLYLLVVTLLKDIRRTFMYHGAEHKAINCFEKERELTVENVQAQSTRHNRCGTTFLFFVMVISILVFSLTTWIMSLIWGDAEWVSHGAVRMLVRLSLLPLVAGLSYELLKLVALTPDNWFFFIFKAPGLALQRLTTRQPDDGMCEIAIFALSAALRMDSDPEYPEVDFWEGLYTEVRADVARRLETAGVTERSEVEWIMRVVCGKDNVKAGLVVKLDRGQMSRLKNIVDRRVKREPLDLILGVSYFYGHRVEVSGDVLLPRMETERVAETAIKLIKDNGAKEVLDLCTGSGCIALAIAKATDANVTASDICESSIELAQKNLIDTDVIIIQGDLLGAVAGKKFDVIVSNPPYIASGVIEGLAPEVKDYSPRLALDGGEDGLAIYLRIIGEAKEFLTDTGVIVLEIGYDQAAAIMEIADANGYSCEISKDYDGNDRVAVLRRK